VLALAVALSFAVGCQKKEEAAPAPSAAPPPPAVSIAPVAAPAPAAPAASVAEAASAAAPSAPAPAVENVAAPAGSAAEKAEPKKGGPDLTACCASLAAAIKKGGSAKNQYTAAEAVCTGLNTAIKSGKATLANAKVTLKAQLNGVPVPSGC
jgi:hypothetical protein